MKMRVERVFLDALAGVRERTSTWSAE